MSGQGKWTGDGWVAPATYRPGDRNDPATPAPIPDVLCGINGCVYLKDHGKEKHSWEHD